MKNSKTCQCFPVGLTNKGYTCNDCPNNAFNGAEDGYSMCIIPIKNGDTWGEKQSEKLENLVKNQNYEGMIDYLQEWDWKFDYTIVVYDLETRFPSMLEVHWYNEDEEGKFFLHIDYDLIEKSFSIVD